MKQITFLLMLCTGIFTSTVAQTDNDVISCGDHTSKDILSVADKMPEFDGDLSSYISKNLRYPKYAKKNNIDGRVVVQFTVRMDGSLDSINVIKSPHQVLTDEVIRFISEMPKWKPGILKEKAVHVRYTMPILFKLDD